MNKRKISRGEMERQWIAMERQWIANKCVHAGGIGNSNGKKTSEDFRDQGNSSSEHPLGKPLYPTYARAIVNMKGLSECSMEMLKIGRRKREGIHAFLLEQGMEGGMGTPRIFLSLFTMQAPT